MTSPEHYALSWPGVTARQTALARSYQHERPSTFEYIENCRPYTHHGIPFVPADRIIIPDNFAIELDVRDGAGLGIRSTVYIKAAATLGVYAGEILSEGSCDDTGYVSALDWPPKAPRKSQLVVDALHAGNWTRFVNHSCHPNAQMLRIMPYDKSYRGPPTLIFETLRPIKIGDWITIRYSPASSYNKRLDEDRTTVQQKIKCACRARKGRCKGWIYGNKPKM